MTTEIDTPMKFRDGKHIRAARTIAGLTRVDLAAAANLHPNSVKYWELDQSPCWPGGRAIDQMAAALASLGVDTEVEQRGNYMIAIVRMR
jgi:transcriptional regulator with XRE-family HTH domain